MLSQKLEKFKSEICEKGIENVFQKTIKKLFKTSKNWKLFSKICEKRIEIVQNIQKLEKFLKNTI